jgi:hypothetical protein
LLHDIQGFNQERLHTFIYMPGHTGRKNIRSADTMYRTSRWLLAVLFIGVLCGPAALPGYAQQDAPLEITHIDTADYPHVRVSVAAPWGHLPDPHTLEVTDDGTPVTDDLVIEQQRVGVAVAIVIDLSRSMRGSGMPDSLDRLEDAREQAIQIARTLDPDTDLVNVLIFNREPTVLYPLDFVDGGQIENLLNSEPRLQAIPDKPGGPSREPTQQDYQNDDYAYAALSEAVATAITLLSNPQTTDQELLERLPTMQKVVVIFSDSCDDSLQAVHSVRCEMPSDVQTLIQRVAQEGSLSIFSVGVGVDDPEAGLPRAPRVRETGFAYNAQFQLLERFAEELPYGSFFHFYASTETEAADVREVFQAQMIDGMVQRGNQLVFNYVAPTERGETHEIVVSSADRRAAASYDIPAIAPVAAVRITNLEESRYPVVGITIERSQDELAEVAYFLNNNTEPVIAEAPPFSLDTSDLQLEPGDYTVQVQATDLRGQVSELSPPAEFTIVEPDPEALRAEQAAVPPSPTWQGFLLENAVAILVLVVLLFSLTAVLLIRPWKRDTAPVVSNPDPSNRITRFYPGDAEFALVVRNGKYAGAQHPIGQLNTYVGADRSRSDIVLDEEYVSGQHVSIQREAQQLYVVDLDSANGVTVNGQRIPPNARVPIYEHTMVGIANVVLECVRIASLQAVNPSGADMQTQAPKGASERTMTYEEDRYYR